MQHDATWVPLTAEQAAAYHPDHVVWATEPTAECVGYLRPNAPRARDGGPFRRGPGL